MSRRKFIFFFCLIFCFIFLIINFPDFYANKKTPKGYFFSGQASYFDPWDINNYLGIINYSQKNKTILVDNLYTTEKTQPTFIYFVYSLAGRFFPFEPLLIYYLLRFFSSVFLLISITYGAHIFLKDNLLRILAVIGVALGGGLGWVFGERFLGADVFIGSFTFFEAWTKPHEGLALTFYILSLTFFFQKRFVLFIISLILLLFFYPYYYLAFSLFVIFVLLIRKILFKELILKKEILTLSLSLIISGVVAFGYSLVLLESSYSQLRNAFLSPPFFSILIGYGFYLLMVLLGFFNSKLRKNKNFIYLSASFFLSLLIVYLPFSFSRLFIRGLFFPLVILALLVIDSLCFNRVKKYYLSFLLIFISLFSTVFITNWRIKEIKNNNPWYYQKNEVRQGFDEIKNLKKDGVLTNYIIGNYLPRYTGRKVFFGHPNQTPNLQKKELEAAKFFLGEFKEDEAKEFLKKNNINIVFILKEERKFNYSLLKKVFENKEVEIFIVNSP